MKKIISLLLCAVMAISIFPVSSFAATIGATPSNPVHVKFGQTYTGGWYGDNDHLNYYTYFEVPEQGLVTFEITKPCDDEGETGIIELLLFDENYEAVWSHRTRDEYNNPKPKYTFTVGLKKGVYLMNITPDFRVTSGFIDFNFKYTFKATKYCETEPNNVAAKATTMQLGKFYSGAFGSDSYEDGEDEYDYYKFPVKKGVSYRIRFKDIEHFVDSSTILDLIVNGEDASGFRGFYGMGDRYDSYGYVYEDYVSEITGYAYIKFWNYFGTPINYDICVSETPTKPSAPKLSKVTNTVSGVKVTWGKVSGADKYYVYRKTASSDWSRIGSTTSIAYTDKTAKSGTTYYYTVKAFNGAGSSSYNKTGIKIKYVATPNLKKIENTEKSLKITWGKVSGADGYIIYRKAAGASSWTKIATVKGGSKVSYKDTKVSSGKSYTYTVRAYDGSTYSSYNTTGISLKFLAMPTLSKVTSSTSGITVNWGKVSGATGYIIYRKTGSGGWKTVGKVTSGSTLKYVDKTAKKGVTYTYTIRAYNGNYKSYYNTKGLTIKDKY